MKKYLLLLIILGVCNLYKSQGSEPEEQDSIPPSLLTKITQDILHEFNTVHGRQITFNALSLVYAALSANGNSFTEDMTLFSQGIFKAHTIILGVQLVGYCDRLNIKPIDILGFTTAGALAFASKWSSSIDAEHGIIHLYSTFLSNLFGPRLWSSFF